MAYVPRAKDGQDTIVEAVNEAHGASSWDHSTVQSYLLGEHQGKSRPTWRLDQLQDFDAHGLPCWVVR